MKKLIILLLLTTSLSADPLKDRIAKFKSAQKFSVLGSASSNALIHARTRASASVTAASSRGLTQDNNVREREVSSQNLINEIKQVEETFISESELEEFIRGIK